MGESVDIVNWQAMPRHGTEKRAIHCEDTVDLSGGAKPVLKPERVGRCSASASSLSRRSASSRPKSELSRGVCLRTPRAIYYSSGAGGGGKMTAGRCKAGDAAGAPQLRSWAMFACLHIYQCWRPSTWLACSCQDPVWFRAAQLRFETGRALDVSSGCDVIQSTPCIVHLAPTGTPCFRHDPDPKFRIRAAFRRRDPAAPPTNPVGAGRHVLFAEHTIISSPFSVSVSDN